MRCLLTGAAGFIGAHVAEHLLINTDYELVFLDKLDVSGNLNRIAQIRGWESFKTRCKFVYHDLRAPIREIVAGQIGSIDRIYHLAAATHVDRSISDALSFVYDNVVGTCNLLDYGKSLVGSIEQFIYFSTDEVFGPAPFGTFHKETDPYNAGNPYAASKAGAEQLCLAFGNTYRLPVKIIHTMNVFGERQHPEKFIPLIISNVLKDKTVIIHADSSLKIIGSRFYLHARNAAASLEFIANKGVIGHSYNVVGEKEVDNLVLAKLIATHLGKHLTYRVVDFHSSRPGHDLRYALDGSKLLNMGWSMPVAFEESLKRTISWYVNNPEWLIN